MDEKDYRIMLTLLKEPFRSNESVGRAVGMSGTAVKRRLDLLAQHQVLAGFVAMPVADVFGRHMRGWLFPPASRAGSVVEDILALDDMVWVMQHQDGSVSVLAYMETAQASAPDALVACLGARPVWEADVRYLLPKPRSPVLSPLEWRVLEAVLPDPRRSIASLAMSTGLSRGTVERYRTAFRERGLLHVAPVIQEARTHGVLLFHLQLLAPSPKHLAAIQEALPGTCPYVRFEDPPGLGLLGIATSMAEALAAERAVAAITGPGQVRLTIPEHHGYALHRVLAWIRRERDRWGERNPREG